MPVRLVVANYGAGQGGLSGNVSVLLGKGDGTFRAPVNYGAGMGAASVASVDFNGDGKADLAVAKPGEHKVSILLNRGDASLHPVGDYPIDGDPTQIAVGDLNGDGKTDLAVGGSIFFGASHGVSVLLGRGDGA